MHINGQRDQDDELLAKLFRAIRKRKAKRVRRLLPRFARFGTDLSCTVPPRCDTALHAATRAGDPAIVRLLVAHGADVNACDRRLRTPLHVASSGEATRALLREAQRFGVHVDLAQCDEQGVSAKKVVLRALERLSNSRAASSDDDSSDRGESSASGDKGLGANAFEERLREESILERDEGGGFDWAGDWDDGTNDGGDWFAQVAAQARARRTREAELDRQRQEDWEARREARRAQNAQKAEEREQERIRWQRAAEAEEERMRLRQEGVAEKRSASAREAARAAYERAWEAMRKRFPKDDRLLDVSELPWPCALTDMTAAKVADTILPPSVEASDLRKLLTEEQRRWHPDKFTAKWSARLRDEQREEVLANVTHVSQCINELLRQEREKAAAAQPAAATPAGS
uniref:NF-kappa-B inhibitor-like protein 1 n=1 Tax=Calcidiscus leptoporus TaxID=127549 RepID=A0A7S0JCT6_9EUKA|mmetsp:Transcript_51819/g.119124  ORF Transcript_51819/g.119124 Transcript_51819/m.119124 type:complete len:403 (+) Transcript_51819:1-1209(+)